MPDMDIQISMPVSHQGKMQNLKESGFAHLAIAVLMRIHAKSAGDSEFVGSYIEPVRLIHKELMSLICLRFSNSKSVCELRSLAPPRIG
jgi:hypothetical protein